MRNMAADNLALAGVLDHIKTSGKVEEFAKHYEDVRAIKPDKEVSAPKAPGIAKQRAERGHRKRTTLAMRRARKSRQRWHQLNKQRKLKHRQKVQFGRGMPQALLQRKPKHKRIKLIRRNRPMGRKSCEAFGPEKMASVLMPRWQKASDVGYKSLKCC